MKNQYGILTKSNRAIQAEEQGKKTYSKLKQWQKNAVDAGKVKSKEWHHTGAAANKTYYYSEEDFENLNPADFKTKKIVKEEQADLKRIKIIITYEKMVGGFTTRNKKFETVEEKGELMIRKKDNMIIGVGSRKLSSNNTKVEYFYLPKGCRKWRTVTLVDLINLGYHFDF